MNFRTLVGQCASGKITRRIGRKVTGLFSIRGWLRGVDLNHRPLGYEPKRSILSPVDSTALPRFTTQKVGQ
jgi:hypothetical protein